MSKPLFTIITVCYNAEKYIEDTMRSVLQQEFDNFEYIIKDGNSHDDTLRCVHSTLDGEERARIISAPDNGIYDAMNIAVEQAKGEYLFFLNAGDCFCNSEVLKKTAAFLSVHKADILYGNIVQIDEKGKSVRKYGNIYKKKFFYLTGDCICHQAIFGKRELFAEKKFDTNYKICADRDWQLFWLDRNAKFLPMHFEISDVLVDGFSRAHIDDYEEEVQRCIRHYFIKGKVVFAIIQKLKRNNLVIKVLRNIERIVLKSDIRNENFRKWK